MISTDLRHTIAFTVLLKRKLWSRYLLDLGASVGLKEHELISIIATAHRLLYLQAYKSPVFPWDAYPIRLWLDVLLHESVSFNCAISSRTKTRAFLVAIRENIPWVLKQTPLSNVPALFSRCGRCSTFTQVRYFWRLCGYRTSSIRLNVCRE